MAPSSPQRIWIVWGLLVAGMVSWARCDSVVPEVGDRLVVEAFVAAGRPLPRVRLWRTQPLNAPYPFSAATAVPDADVVLRLGGTEIPYEPIPGTPGLYGPAVSAGLDVPERMPVAVEAVWGSQQASARSTVPPALRLDSVRVEVPDEPVDGIILDSLFFDPAQFDSLRLDSLQTGAQQGLVYLVEVTLWWTAGFDEIGADSAYWIRAQLKPILQDLPTFDDFFFRPDDIRRERSLASPSPGRHRWTGVYAVPVETPDDPLPPHRLRVALVRSGEDYARYVTSRRDPDRREPTTNVEGALGIVAGLALDSLSVRVE